MASENKKRKLTNSFMCASGLKNNKKGIRKLHFYTASERKAINEIKNDN